MVAETLESQSQGLATCDLQHYQKLINITKRDKIAIVDIQKIPQFINN